jgi:hypothetical protein
MGLFDHDLLPQTLVVRLITKIQFQSPSPPSWAHRRNYFRQQDLQAARTTASLGRVLGLGHLDCLLARHRSAFCARRQVPSAHKVTRNGFTDTKVTRASLYVL